MAGMKALNRRAFAKSSFAAAASFAVIPNLQSASPASKVVLGTMGLGGRGTWLTQAFAKRADVAFAWLCDADLRRANRARESIAKSSGRELQVTQDFRRMLEDKAVDAIINATPDHWHGLGTVLACQAGKDVYVEKPLSHNLREGRQMVDAARKYNRVVQVGLQSRSAPYVQEAVEVVRSGTLGDLHLVKVFNSMSHPMRKIVPDQAPPAELDWDLWSGPAAKLPYNPGKYWLNYFEYSCGPIPGDLVHQLDLARMLLGDPPTPDNVTHSGGILALKDGRDTPDMQLATFDYGSYLLQFEAALWTPYLTKTPMELRDQDRLPNWPFNATRIELHGTRGFMYVGRHGDGWQVFNEKAEPVKSRFGRQGDPQHQDNFLKCIRNRKRPNTDVEQGHLSTLLCHLANISFRVGNRKLAFDPVREFFRDAPDADALLGRKYREPFVMPERV
jgi:predicted dehydrogenase